MRNLPCSLTRRHVLQLAAGIAAFPLVSCGRFRTKETILKLAAGAKTRADLEKALGPPDDRQVLAVLEHWTYEGRDGDVTFHIAGDRVVFVDTVGLGVREEKSRGGKPTDKENGEQKDSDDR